MSRRSFGLPALLVFLAACHHDAGDAELLINVNASGSPQGIVALKVTVNGPAGPWPETYMPKDNGPISFPTTLSARLPARATGTLSSVDVDAEDGSGASIASGHATSVMIRAGERKTITIQLDCGGSPCVVDGGAGDNDGGAPPPSCGNGRVDQGETCDTAIAAGVAGACPTSCDDHVACTNDTMTGSECTLSCAHDPITAAKSESDGCCPANSAAKDDPDCSRTCGDGIVDLGETCDTATPHGSPGACPSDEDCTAGASCSSNLLVSAGTCSAVCMHYPIVAQLDGDGCCPPGATHAVDGDCPIVCGNGIVEPGETCDIGIVPRLPGVPGACPTSCPRDPCKPSVLSGSGCQTACSTPIEITAPLSGDGCCPEGANQATDNDCAPVCGNGVTERGEACDKGHDPNKPAGNCPTSCPPVPATPSSCLRAKVVGSVDDCTARCEVVEETECVADGCCPAGCTAANDPDCGDVATYCGDGAVEASHGEQCDIGARQPPTACPTSCDDAKACTQDILVSAGTCAATCMHVPVTSFRTGDGCCAFAAGGNFTLDPDCAPVCGNGVVESPAESCDFAVQGSCPGPDSCPPPMGCTSYVVKGTAGACSATCVALVTTTCANGDHCCPPGCDAAHDDDCPVVCGNGIVESGETCDRAITAGMAGACPRSCDDGNACTTDLASGSTDACTRTCAHVPITACITGDGCCAPGCSADADHDCAPRCGDGLLGAGEACDPPASCPTSCPDDGDPCTTEQLGGDPASCATACLHIPIKYCTLGGPDGCCPTGCSAANDFDCR